MMPRAPRRYAAATPATHEEGARHGARARAFTPCCRCRCHAFQKEQRRARAMLRGAMRAQTYKSAVAARQEAALKQRAARKRYDIMADHPSAI